MSKHTNKNTRLIIILAALIVISVGLALTERGGQSGNIQADKFKIEDTTAIDRINIKSPKVDHSLERTSSGWQLNETYDVDPSLIKIASFILNNVQAKRPVSRVSNEEIVNELKTVGYAVSIELKSGDTRRLIVGGNATKTRAYFMEADDDRAYIVEIPGYSNYLSGIFELTTDQWRDRLLFSSSWRTIQQLTLDFFEPYRTDLEIGFDGNFLAAKGVTKMDTTAFMKYIGQYEYFQINDFLQDGKYPRYDSLKGTNPVAILKLKDIDVSKNSELKIFNKIPGERFYLVTDEAEQMMVIDAGRMDNLLVSPQEFISE